MLYYILHILPGKERKNTAMTAQEALKYINSPARVGAPTLEAMRALMARLGDVQNTLRFVHVAGTNGKGSTAAMIESMLRAAGYRTGLFTSPHLLRFSERIRVNGAEIADAALAAAAERVRAAETALGRQLTVFERTTAIAMLHFAAQRCDIVVLEVGLGGRFDATNVIGSPDCAVITNIGLDHTALLGDTVEQIALEKAGIIKPGCAVAMYEPEHDAVAVEVAAVCRDRGASLRIADFDEIEVLDDGLDGQIFCYCDDRPLRLPLPGDHQTRNAAVALEAVEILRERGWKRLTDEAVEHGLAAVRWPARFELAAREPAFVIDGGHNPQCAAALAENLDYYFPDTRRVLLLGMLADKDAAGFCAALAPLADAFVCVAPESPRALAAEELAALLTPWEKPVFCCGSAAEAAETARKAAGRGGMVCAAGSLYLAGALRKHFGLE